MLALYARYCILFASRESGSRQTEKGIKTMLVELLNEFTDMYQYRIQSDTVYSGYGTTLYRLVCEYFDNGGTVAIIHKIDALAYTRACATQ